MRLRRTLLASTAAALLVGVFPATASAHTVSCSTGGYAYMTDSAWTAHSNVGGTRPHKYVNTFSGARTEYTPSGTPVKHTPKKIVRYSNGNVLEYPATQGFTVYSTAGTEDYRIYWEVYPSGSTVKITSCANNH